MMDVSQMLALQAMTLGPPLDLPASEPVTRSSSPGVGSRLTDAHHTAATSGASVIFRSEILSESGEEKSSAQGS